MALCKGVTTALDIHSVCLVNTHLHREPDIVILSFHQHSFHSDPEGDIPLFSSVVAPMVSHDAMKEAEALGIRVARGLFAKGAGPILEAAKAEIAERRK